ncbi:MAG: polyprenyl synthetase family protein [Chloroflexi bacterium]|nr:polyprenyl synthetase family protein [Chloroflexota bacterium]
METIPGVFHKFAEQIDRELREIVETRPLPLYRMMSYHMGWIDEHGNPYPGGGGGGVRSTLCLLACEAAGGEPSKALPAAAAIDLAYNFSLIHDDIQGGKPQRGNRPALWWVWGPAQAINAGDGMHALARLSLFRLRDKGFADDVVFKSIQILDDACLKLCEGQYLDITYQERIDVSVSSYLAMIESKTGALMEGAIKLGALLGSEEEALVEALGLFGRKLGMVFQVRGDIADLWNDASPTKTVSNDILNKKKTLPVLYAIEVGVIRDKRELGEIYFKRVLEPQDIAKVVAVLDRLGAREYCQKMLAKLYHEAMELLDASGLSRQATASLRSAAEHIVKV